MAFQLEDSTSGASVEQGEYWVVFNPLKYKAGGVKVESWVDSTVGDALLVEEEAEEEQPASTS